MEVVVAFVLDIIKQVIAGVILYCLLKEKKDMDK